MLVAPGLTMYFAAMELNEVKIGVWMVWHPPAMHLVTSGAIIALSFWRAYTYFSHGIKSRMRLKEQKIKRMRLLNLLQNWICLIIVFMM